MLSADQYYKFTQLAAVSPNKFSAVLGNGQRDSTDRFIHFSPHDIASIARDARGSKHIQEHLLKPECRSKIFNAVLNYGWLVTLAKDQSGNFVIQKMIETSPSSNDSNQRLLYEAVLANVIDLSSNRFSCRVVQKLVEKAPNWCVSRVLAAYSGNEVAMSIDANANHVIQCIFKTHPPLVYENFVRQYVNRGGDGLRKVIQDRFGCRVIQACLEELVVYCKGTNEAEKIVAFSLFKCLIPPILGDAIAFSEDQFANYIVQYLLREDFMERQRKYIIKNSVLHNILWLSQSKYASHVVEYALMYADPPSLRAMFNEILDGYEPDSKDRDALDIMLFDQYANYVVQCLLKIAIDVYNGVKMGDRQWLHRIAEHVYKNMKLLERYSSGKKILDLLHSVFPAQPVGVTYNNNDVASFYPSNCALTY